MRPLGEVLKSMGVHIANTVAEMATSFASFLMKYKHIIIPFIAGVAVAGAVLFAIPTWGFSLTLTLPALSAGGTTLMVASTVSVSVSSTAVAGAVGAASLMAVRGAMGDGSGSESSSGESNTSGSEGSGNNGYNGDRNVGADYQNGSSLDQHFNDHDSDFGYTSSDQYLKGSQSFFDSPPPGTEGFMGTNGQYYQYNPSTNTFGVINQYGGISTFFKPDCAGSYCAEQIAKWMK